ncbi:General secretion pathway protein K [Candidatus Rhodobacter oscarellae]|uniref:Type II secretion system protein K n=1 Tax=Candidatus Rhodobacter oscarellae TaxID=1675527 RepID=A0A0J9E9E4_9RHOB|nr:type II secretion system protein GspK [Candidatus Rhodobacter lobularis]KMW59405.1 General secretion pathway protein K [Candidatus Rhodobacter lobularis]
MSARDQSAGVSLLNTLVVIAVGASLAHAMLSDQDAALSRLGATQNLAQATALANGGIASVATALQRDFREAPEADHLREPWAQAAQQQIELDFGTFEVEIVDARGRFDLNALTPVNLAEQRLFAALLVALDLPKALGAQISRIIAQNGPLRHPDDLRRYGISDGDLERLTPYLGTFQTRGAVNVNAADAPVLSALFGNAELAQSLSARRSAKGFLDASDLAAFGAILPSLGSFASDSFDIRAVVRVGQAKVEIHRRLTRDPRNGQVRSSSIQ